MKPMTKLKQLNDLTLLDRFLFASVMEDEEMLELALSIIMGEEVHLRQLNQVEKEFRTMPWLRSVRLDVYNVDENDRVYDAEVQERNTGNLAKRSRFYQALIDSTLLPPGRDVGFNQLPESCLIMVTPFDLWGHGKYRYTFKTQCEEVPGLYLEDGTTRIFLNTRGTNDDEVSPELVELLHYMEKTTDEAAKQCKSGRVKKLHERVHEVRASEEFGVKYMQAWEEKMYERLEGREEGLAEGHASGLAEGRELGREEGHASGLAEGRAEGLELGEKRVSALTQNLLGMKRYDDLERALSDSEYRETLYREFGL